MSNNGKGKMALLFNCAFKVYPHRASSVSGNGSVKVSVGLDTLWHLKISPPPIFKRHNIFQWDPIWRSPWRCHCCWRSVWVYYTLKFINHVNGNSRRSKGRVSGNSVWRREGGGGWYHLFYKICQWWINGRWREHPLFPIFFKDFP